MIPCKTFSVKLPAPLLLILLIAMSCNNGESSKTPVRDTVGKKPVLAVTAPANPKAPAKRPPIINVMDTLLGRRTVISIRDSATTLEGLSTKLALIYGTKLPALIKKNRLKIMGPPMAWYKSKQAPYFFEAGLQVDRKPAKTSKGVTVKEFGTDSVLVAHFYGPYDLTPQAYTAVAEIMHDRKKKASKPAYEVYVDDPYGKDGKPKDPYKVQTDIVFPIK